MDEPTVLWVSGSRVLCNKVVIDGCHAEADRRGLSLGRSFGGSASERLGPKRRLLGRDGAFLELGRWKEPRGPTELSPLGEEPPRSAKVRPAEPGQDGDGPGSHLIVIRLCDFLYWQTVCQQLLLAERPRCAYKALCVLSIRTQPPRTSPLCQTLSWPQESSGGQREEAEVRSQRREATGQVPPLPLCLCSCLTP